jgi:hypothetical protein
MRRVDVGAVGDPESPGLDLDDDGSGGLDGVLAS